MPLHVTMNCAMKRADEARKVSIDERRSRMRGMQSLLRHCGSHGCKGHARPTPRFINITILCSGIKVIAQRSKNLTLVTLSTPAA